MTLSEVLEGVELRLSDGGDLPPLDDGRGRPKGCMWHGSVCTESPTRYVVTAAVEGPGDALLLCDRHWVLWIAEEVEVTTQLCGHDLTDHVTALGVIGGARWEVRPSA